MLEFYYHPISGNARRVWIALLEKQIPFGAIALKLDGDQFQPDFLAINPFHHIPAIVDDGFAVIESLAILDYLEAKYPEPPLMPKDPQAIAIVRMVELVTLNEIVPANLPLMRQMVELPVDPKQLEAAQQKIATALAFFENKLGNNPFLVEQNFTFADIVAGNALTFLRFLGVALDAYPQLKAWFEKIEQRDSFIQTTPSPEVLATVKPLVKAQLEKL